MPRILKCDEETSCSLDEAIAALATLNFDPGNETSLSNAACWLNRLGNNRTFLAEVLVSQLAGRPNPTMAIDSGYGAQAIVLSRQYSGARGGMFLRANIWPAEHDLCFQTSGARNFVYGVPHDHNFSFLTYGYSGPGYRSDYYEYDYEAVAGYPGEKAALRFVERSALEQGKLMLYRANRDIHSQIPPEALSVSLNVMHVDPAQSWFDQYGFDLARAEITGTLGGNSTEVFLRVAVALGSEDALDFAQWVGATHPSERLRLASFEARAESVGDVGAEDHLWSEAERCGSRLLAAIAKRRRAELAR